MTQEEFVNDPIVPIELRLRAKKQYTLYQPSWDGASPTASAFLGGHGKVLAFDSLDALVAYVDSGAPASFSSRERMSQLRLWTTDAYRGRLCEYDLSVTPEVPDRSLTDDEQLALGSTFALALDLVDQIELRDEHAEALGEDADIGRLAEGDTTGGLYGGAREHLVGLLGEHWAPTIAEIARHVEIPSSSAGGSVSRSDTFAVANNPNSRLLEDLAPAVTLWFGLSEAGAYTIRTTTLTDGYPRYAGSDRLRVWPEPEDLQADLVAGKIGLDFKELPADVDVTPGDDLIFDLVEVGESITERMTADHADALVSAWTEIVRLAGWGGWSDVQALTLPGSPIGSFIVSCAIDLAQVRPGSDRALGSADLERIRSDWTTLVELIESHTTDA